MAQRNVIQSPMSADEFFLWIETQEWKHELIDGYPMAMAGTNRTHDDIVANLGGSIFPQLRGKPCRPHTADFAIQVSATNIRYPDYSVDCGKPTGDAKAADLPTLVVEVLSKSTKTFDGIDKLAEYQSIQSMKYILLVDQDTPSVRFYERDKEDKWIKHSIIGLSSKIEMPAIGVSIKLEELYDGIQFHEMPEPAEVCKICGAHPCVCDKSRPGRTGLVI